MCFSTHTHFISHHCFCTKTNQYPPSILSLQSQGSFPCALLANLGRLWKHKCLMNTQTHMDTQWRTLTNNDPYCFALSHFHAHTPTSAHIDKRRPTLSHVCKHKHKITKCMNTVEQCLAMCYVRIWSGSHRNSTSCTSREINFARSEQLGVWRNGSASDSRSEGWEFELLSPHILPFDECSNDCFRPRTHSCRFETGCREARLEYTCVSDRELMRNKLYVIVWSYGA